MYIYSILDHQYINNDYNYVHLHYRQQLQLICMFDKWNNMYSTVKEILDTNGHANQKLKGIVNKSGQLTSTQNAYNDK